MKRMTAKEILAASFKELAQDKPINKITVQDIVGNCGYSPATFYRNFSDKFDLIAWDYATSCREIVNQSAAEGRSWQETVAEACRHFQANQDYMRNLLRNTSGRDSFVKYESAIDAELMSQAILRRTGEADFDEDLRRMVTIYSYGTAQYTCEWLLSGCSLPADKMAELFIEALPEKVAAILCS
ncbi:MAG: TetR/AcrR family transcriptional regulator [Olsenella sp.]|jgi:AcrR family transcriptional regulator|nr:TetR/AcrR family transcriptional regulator [Olsenella sp.]MCH3957688.1 TetR/AcrR family transcriptional regulator [Olsenella sp.]MCI2127574.1 TetR/AcrR family transcriptional regulator [Olsenella sp.]MCI2156532.1 TetR/AcrR family transcriptional regulator [Olsenella sp.]MCI2188079.1 TetR/AcrR family transcriptional regulator [Olsenella sp.]